MEIDYKGANCVVIKDKEVTLVVDPTSQVAVSKDMVVLATQPAYAGANTKDNLVIDMPGEYEHCDISLRGIAVPAHLAADEKALDATLYYLKMNNLGIAIIGNTTAPLSDTAIEEMGEVDIVIVPIGGGGTLDAVDAAAIVRQLSPSVVIPTHYNDGHTKYEVPQADTAAFEKEMGSDNIERQSVFKLKQGGTLPATTTTYILSRTK